MTRTANKLVGVVPAAGRATRISPLPCSKEIFPVGRHARSHPRAGRVKAACDWLLNGMQQAGVRKVYIVLRPGKWDIPAYLGNGRDHGLHLAYLTISGSAGVPFTVKAAFPFIKEDTVLFGFPDILFEPTDVYAKLLETYNGRDFDVVIGLFPAHTPQKMDMVRLDEQGRLTGIDIKPRQTDLTHTWLHAVWSPTFSRYLNEFITRRHSTATELHMGHVFVDALQNGISFGTVFFDHYRYLDIGTPGDLTAATDRFGGGRPG